MNSIGKHIVYNFYSDITNIIKNGSQEDFIAFAKSYNIFQQGGTKFYKTMCDKIKERLDKEGLSHETVRPD